jgi:hypothetical protein
LKVIAELHDEWIIYIDGFDGWKKESIFQYFFAVVWDAVVQLAKPEVMSEAKSDVCRDGRRRKVEAGSEDKKEKRRLFVRRKKQNSIYVIYRRRERRGKGREYRIGPIRI